MVPYAAEQKLRMEDIAFRAITEVSTDVIKATPVDTGQTRNNWQSGLDRIPAGQLLGKDKSGNQAEARVMRDSADAVGRVFYLVNNLPWIRKLEYGFYPDGPKTVDGFSKQAPQGMVRLAVQRWDQIALAALRSVKQRPLKF